MPLEGLTYEDAWVIASLLLAQKKTIPPHQWVDSLVEEAEASGSFLTFGIQGGGEAP